MKEIKALILGVGGNVSQGIIKAIRKSDLNVKIIGACISAESLGLYMCDEAYISPYASDQKFIPWLINICNDLCIDIVLTGVEENILEIEKNIDLFNTSTKTAFIASSYEKLLIGQDKYKTCEWLKQNNCNYPQYCRLNNLNNVHKLINKVGFPLIAKPCLGKSSLGVHLITCKNELEKIWHFDNYVLEECIGNNENEYTVGCYVDKIGVLKDIIIMHRRLKNGTTVWAEVVENKEIYQEASKICKAYQPKGPLNIQMRLDKLGRPVCFEMNVRFSGTTAMRAHFGFEDVAAMIKEYILHESIDSCFHVQMGEAYRYDNELYMFHHGTEIMRQKQMIRNLNAYNIYIDKLK